MAEKRSTIRFFGEVDRVKGNVSGEIKNTYPAWYYSNKLEEEEGSISRLKHRIFQAETMGGFMADQLPQMRNELRRKELRFDNIIRSKPKLSDKDMDTIAGLYSEFGTSIGDSLVSYSKMQKGTTNAAKEARMMTEPCINIPPGAVMHLQEMGIDAKRGGKISRNDAQKAWKIMGNLLGEETNAETLRRDHNTGTYRSDRSLREMSRD